MLSQADAEHKHVDRVEYGFILLTETAELAPAYRDMRSLLLLAETTFTAIEQLGTDRADLSRKGLAKRSRCGSSWVDEAKDHVER